MSKRRNEESGKARRQYTQEFKEEAVQMLLDGHLASSVCERLGVSGSVAVQLEMESGSGRVSMT